MEKRKILIIDDDQPTREMHVVKFKEEGFEVREAKDGLEGLDMVSQEKPDIIFTGIIMPRMGGFTLMRNLKKHVETSQIPVLISSHLGREEDRKEAENLGAKGFLVRGMVTPKQVVETVNKVLEGKNVFYFDVDERLPVFKELAKYLDENNPFVCPRCGERKVLKLISNSTGRKEQFRVSFVCPRCERTSE